MQKILLKQNYIPQNGNGDFLNQKISHTSSPFIFRESEARAFSYYCQEQTGNKILQNLSPEAFYRLSPLLEKVQLNKNQKIYESGDSVRFIYFPETAVISEFQILADGKMAEVAIIGSESLHGISALLDLQTSQNWAQTLIAGTAFKVRTDAFLQYFNNCENIRKHFFAFLNSYIGQISGRVICNKYHLISERFCSWLLMINDRSQNKLFSLTQEQIACSLGTHRPSITTMMQSLRTKNVIDYMRGKISIRDREQLELLACSCYEATNAQQIL